MTLLLGKADICRSAPRLVKPGGQLAVIDNLKVGDGRYLQEPWFDETFARNGLRRVLKLPIRNSRWPVVYLIRYGLIPTHWLAAIAEWELKRMAKKRMPSRLSYYNYLFIYEKS
ncbi:hypothetical protein HEP75_01061 [Xanthomonas sp. SI]|nr:hypothetical protein HEP75_01061 [Xanthomonas sp. SI]